MQDEKKTAIRFKRQKVEKTHPCTVCNKLFNTAGDMKKHTKNHSREKCFHCDKALFHAGALRIHMRKHTEEKPYPCIQCGNSFTAASALKSHMNGHTGEKPPQLYCLQTLSIIYYIPESVHSFVTFFLWIAS